MRLLLVLAVIAVSGPLHAEVDPERPVPVLLRATLAGSNAQLAVRYRLPVKGPTRGTQLVLALPRHGVVTDAFVTVDGQRQRHHLDLDRKAHARARFDTLDQHAGGRSRAWAVQLSVEDLGLVVELEVAHDATVTLDLVVETETCFHADLRFAEIPAMWRPAVVRATTRGGNSDACTERYVDPDIDGERAWIELPSQEASSRPFGEQRITTTGARLDVPHGHFARFELALAHAITQIAPDLYTVFVIDGSRSVTSRELEVQVKLIESYAKHAADSHVQVIAYARTAQTLLPRWMRAKEAPIAATLAALDPRNGSNLDVGIAAASALLDKVTGTRRIVVLSDQRVSARVGALDPRALTMALPAGTLVHVVALSESSTREPRDSITRDDTIVLAGLARATEGLAAIGQLSPDDKIDALGLVRPIALDHVRLETAGWSAAEIGGAELACPTDGKADLREGSSCTWWGRGPVQAGSVKLSGLLWNHRVTRDIAPIAQPRTVARWLSGRDDQLLGAAAQEILEAAAAINRDWSMLAIWGGTAGYGDLPAGLGVGVSGCGCATGSQDGSRVGFRNGRLIPSETLQQQIERGVAACHATEKVEITLELTLDEIVDVTVKTSDPVLRECVTEAVWNVPVLLPKPVNHETRTVSLAP